MLSYWFTNKNDPTDQWNASLWFHGGLEVDAFILQHFGPLIESVGEALEKHESAPSENPCVLSTNGKIATIILLDQFSRHAFRGSKKMYQFDRIASSLAKKIFQDQQVPFSSLPWTHRIFVLICLTHVEDEFSVNEAARGMSALAGELHQDPQSYAPVLVTRIKRLFKNTESHLAVIKR